MLVLVSDFLDYNLFEKALANTALVNKEKL